MPKGQGSLRGDVNAILNGLIREGVITSFETNFDDPVSTAFALHVRVAADHLGSDNRTAKYEERRREVQSRIMRQLEPLAPGVIVSVRGALAKAAAQTPGGITGQECRAARRLLGWTLRKHAAASRLSNHTVGAFERGEGFPLPETLAAIVGALEAAGIEFAEDGVRMKPEALKRKR